MMTTWARMLKAYSPRIDYENPAFGQRRPRGDTDFALITLPGNFVIDVMWDGLKDWYVVRLTGNGFASTIAEYRCNTPYAAIAAVHECARTAHAAQYSLDYWAYNGGYYTCGIEVKNWNAPVPTYFGTGKPLQSGWTTFPSATPKLPAIN